MAVDRWCHHHRSARNARATVDANSWGRDARIVPSGLSIPRAVSPVPERVWLYEGRNCRVLFLWTEGRSDRYPALIDELAAQRVAVIVTFGHGIQAARLATTTVPIVGVSADMVKSGLAASLAHPGSNATGVSILASELDAKRLELLHEAVPSAKRIGVLAVP